MFWVFFGKNRIANFVENQNDMENLEVAKAREQIMQAAINFGDLDHAIDCFVAAMDEERQRKISYLREQVGKVICNIELDRHEVAVLACRVIDENLKKI